MHASFQHRGRSYSIHLSEGLVHLEGEFAGNMDLAASVTPSIAPSEVVKSLSVRIVSTADVPEMLEVLAYSVGPQSVELTFFSEQVAEGGRAPQTVDVFWGRDRAHRLGSLACSDTREP
jgi:hypothetical protein